MPLLEFRVYGVPAPQGSKRYVGRGIMVESSKKVRPWRADVLAASMIAVDKNQWSKPITEPVKVQVEFYFPRPKNHYGTGRNAQKLKQALPSLSLAVAKGIWTSSAAQHSMHWLKSQAGWCFRMTALWCRSMQ